MLTKIRDYTDEDRAADQLDAARTEARQALAERDRTIARLRGTTSAAASKERLEARARFARATAAAAQAYRQHRAIKEAAEND